MTDSGFDSTKNMGVPGALSGYRVLDLADEKGVVCGKILADLGADVIKIERPGGDPMRNIGPFYKDIVHPEKSLFWFAYNANKRSITLDIKSPDGRDIFLRLAKTADFVIESFDPGYLDGLRLGYGHLSKLNPRIIVTSVTSYGQDGPKANYKGGDLLAWASGGPLYVTGDRDRPPCWISFQQAFHHAGGEAATASLIAHWTRETTGQGQHVDVSMQATGPGTTSDVTPEWDARRRIVQRPGPARYTETGVKRCTIFSCKDGYVATLIVGGGAAGLVAASRGLVRWMHEEGMSSDWLDNFDWANQYDASKMTQDTVDRVEGAVAKFFLTKSRRQIFEESLKRGIMVAPVNSVADLCHEPQLEARGYWVPVYHPELGDTIPYCGPSVKMSETPQKVGRAPLIGEHNAEIYEGELGLNTEQLVLLKQAQAI